jgi:hypothetical protein
MRIFSHIIAGRVARWLTLLTIAAAVGAALSTARPSAVLAVPQVPAQVSVSSSENPSYYGQAVTLTADVAPIRGGGHVEFLFSDMAVCPNVPLSQRQRRPEGERLPGVEQDPGMQSDGQYLASLAGTDDYLSSSAQGFGIVP